MIRALAVLACLALPAWAQPLPAGLDATAGVIAISTEEQTFIDTFGQPTRDDPRPITQDDAWHIGSLGKAMTATLAARLVAQGRLTWETPIGDLLDASDRWADITLAELLTHRSGMAENLTFLRRLLRPDRAGYVAHMLAARPGGPRGAYLYSNAGYVVAGAMLEAATGRLWEDLIRTEVWEPLGMEGMGFGPPLYIRGDGGRADPAARGSDNPPAMGPAGTVHAPARAMLLFLDAHRTRPSDFLPPEQWARLHQPVGDYAMGWNRRSDAVLVHFGSNTMWLAGMAISEDVSVFVAVNQASEPALEVLQRQIESALRATPD